MQRQRGELVPTVRHPASKHFTRGFLVEEAVIAA